MTDLHRQPDVNFFGSDATTKAVQPYLGRRRRARIPPWTPTTHPCTSCWAQTRCA